MEMITFHERLRVCRTFRLEMSGKRVILLLLRLRYLSLGKSECFRKVIRFILV